MKNKIYLNLIFMVTVLIGCKSGDTIIPQQFNVVSPLALSNPGPNFKIEQTKITAKFDQSANWKITITGNVSGASKIFSGATAEININWNGLSDKLPLFGTEECKVELSFPDFPAKPKQVQKLVPKGLANIDREGILITAFTTPRVDQIYDPKQTPVLTNWQSDWQPTDNVHFQNPSAPDGTPYLYSTGHGGWQTPTNPYVDYLLIKPATSDQNYGLYWPVPNYPNRVYFNAMVYCSKLDSSLHYKDASIVFAFGQEDGNVGSFTLAPNWEGWKIVSVNYNSLVFTKSDLPRPDRITSLNIILLSNAYPLSSTEIKVAYDHLIFTLDRPFNPFFN